MGPWPDDRGRPDYNLLTLAQWPEETDIPPYFQRPMTSPRHATRPWRVTLVTAGLALGTLGGVTAGVAVLLDSGPTAPVARTAAVSTPRVAADRSVAAALRAAAIASA